MADEQQKTPETEEVEEQQQASTEGEVPAGEDNPNPEAADAAEMAEEPSLEELVARLQEDVAAAEDAALRAQADAQNVKRRAEQEVERARKFALERFTGDLLPVVDNLERALEATGGEDEILKPIAEGVELTLKSFLDVMKKFNVEVVDPQGEPFDPDYHQAVSMVENNDVEPNTVIAVMQKGYTLNGRLVRAAMVMVAKNGG